MSYKSDWVIIGDWLVYRYSQLLVVVAVLLLAYTVLT